MAFNFNLDNILKELGITMNHLSVESKIRSATVIGLCKGDTKRLELSTVESILNTLNEIAKQQGKNMIYTIDSIIEYKYE